MSPLTAVAYPKLFIVYWCNVDVVNDLEVVDCTHGLAFQRFSGLLLISELS